MKALSIFAVLACMAFPAAGDSDSVSCLQVAQQQACCTKNKGVCGCRAGKIVCCDKTFAEGCSCARDDEPPIS